MGTEQTLRRDATPAEWEIAEAAILVKKPRQREHWSQRFVINLAASLLLVTPLFFGGKQTVVLHLSLFAIFLLAIVIGLQHIAGKRTADVATAGTPGRLARRLYSIGFLFTVVVAIQLIEVPLGVLEVVSATTAEAYRIAGAAWGSLSVDRANTFSGLIAFFGYAMVGFAVVLLPMRRIKTTISGRGKQRRSRSRHQILDRAREIDSVLDLFQRVIIASGIICSLVALAHLTTGTIGLFGVFGLEHRGLGSGRAHWPFVNPNHLAVLIEIAIVLAVTRLLRLTQLTVLRSGEREPKKLSVRMLRSPEKLGVHVVQLLGIFVLLLGGILTLSRTGSILIVFGLAALWMAFQRFQFAGTKPVAPARRSRRTSPIAELFARLKQPLLMGAALLLVLLFLGQGARDRLATRIEYGLASGYGELRSAFNSASVDVIGEFPLFGVGLGNWHLAATRYVPETLSGYSLDYAHNDYFQLIAETGMLGAVALLAVLVSLVLITRRAWRRELLPSDRLLLFGSSLALLLPLIHATVDFPFHIPGLALTFVVALALHVRLVDSILDESSQK